MKRNNGERLAAIAPYLWLGLFFLFPFVLVLRLSLSDQALAMPPYAPQIDWSAGLGGIKTFVAALDLETYARLTSDDLYLVAYLSSLRFAAIGTILCLLVGYPIALGMARCAP
ncbi:MAG: putrescine ABC transporter permease PotH, partial [Caulobacter sp.]